MGSLGMIVMLLLLLVVAWLPRASSRGSEPEPSAQALQQQVNAAIAAGASRFALPSGTFAFNAASFNVTGARGLQLIAASQGQTTWLFDCGHGLRLVNCEVRSRQTERDREREREVG